MATIHVSHDIDDLARDCAQIPKNLKSRATRVVKGNVRRGKLTTQRIAQNAAGEHGKNYFKRISGEMTGPFEGEYGPSAVQGTRYVGVSGNEGAGRDLDKSLRTVGPAFARDVSRMIDSLYWP